ncbi:UPF0175 family protein [Halobacteriales archaeon Cl-PHB]
METVTTRIPEEDEELLSELEAEQSADRSEVLRRLIRDGLTEWRKERALEELDAGNLTVRKAADLAGVEYVEMLDMASDAGVDVGYDVEEMERDLDRV